MRLLTTRPLIPSPSPSSGCPPGQPPQFYVCRMPPVRDIPVASLGQLCWPRSLPRSSCTPGQHEAESLALCKRCSAAPKHRGVSSVVLLLNPNRSTAPATRKNITSVPAETRTPIRSFILKVV